MKLLCFCFATVFGLAAGSALAQPTNYHSPIDGRDYTADWHTYTPDPKKAKDGHTNAVSGSVHLENIRLLNTQEDFGRNVAVDELTKFIGKEAPAVDGALGGTNEAFNLLIKTTLSKDKRPVFTMASSKDAPQDVLQRVYDRLNALPDYRTKADEVSYEVQYRILKRP